METYMNKYNKAFASSVPQHSLIILSKNVSIYKHVGCFQ